MIRLFRLYCCKAIAVAGVALFCTCVAGTAQAQNLKNPTDMVFGEIMYLQNGSGVVQLATNGNVNYVGSYSGTGIGSAGSIEIGGKKTTYLISCETTGTLSTGTETFTLRNIEIWQTPGTSWGNGYTCQGLDVSPYAMTVTGVNDSVVMIGAEIDLNSAPTSGGAANTSNTGGQSITFRILEQ